MKLWSARFDDSAEKDHAKLVEAFNASIPFDHLLFQDDLIGSAAHTQMLYKIGVLDSAETKQILDGLAGLYAEFTESGVNYTIGDEDIHTLVELKLKNKIGAVAGKLHTGRSRNDQVALDIHLFCRRGVVRVTTLLHELMVALSAVASGHLDTIMPGYTHLQRAQPVTFAHHLLAYVAKFSRDFERFQGLYDRTNRLPLGAGAIAGSTFPLDRQFVAKLLRFDSVYENSMDAVSDRDFIVEFLAFASLTMVHLSRISEEIILWCSSEFGFIELSDEFCTGSSMMPQKKNPDVAELVRGKTGRVVGSLMGLLTVLKGLPLTYNKDMQEDKEGLFDTYKTLTTCLSLFAPMISGMKVQKSRMLAAAEEDFSNATDLADYLARKGLPFREAYGVVGALVRLALQEKKVLRELSLAQFQAHSPLFDESVFPALKLETVVGRRESEGGTSPTQVARQLEGVQLRLNKMEAWLHQHREAINISPADLFSLDIR